MKKKIIFLDFGGVLADQHSNPVPRIKQTLLAQGYSREVADVVAQAAEADWKTLPASAGWISTWAQEQEIIGNYFAKVAQSIPNSPAELAWVAGFLIHS